MSIATPTRNEEDVKNLSKARNAEVRACRQPSLGYRIIKRCFDVLMASVALILLSPILLILTWLVHREDGGPAAYVCTRIGKNGKPIQIRKFRSMVEDGDNLEKYLTPEQLQEYYSEFKLGDDPRITRIGNFLRKSSLDELLQLISIIKGDMSLVGPRPIVKEELSHYTEQELAELLSVRPGLTGYWQVNGRNNAEYKTGERQALELYYVRNCSLWLDTKILFQTVGVVLKREGAQ